MAAKREKVKLTVERKELEDEVPDQPRPPQNPDELAKYVRDHMGAHVSASAVLEGSDGPLAYLVHSFFEGRFTITPDGQCIDHDKDGTPRPPSDSIVWANRGGGKTFLGAVATALDLLFKLGIEIRILGGSAEQSRRMHDHLRKIFENEGLELYLDGRTTENRIRLTNRSRVEILSHSERSVRGVRVQKLRCDEVDLFEPDLWKAAQLVTRSASPIHGPWGNEVRGTIEVLSTMHVPMGMMWKIVQQGRRANDWIAPSVVADSDTALSSSAVLVPWASPAPGATRLGSASLVPVNQSQPQNTTLAQSDGSDSAQDKDIRILFKWGVVDALEKCGDEHVCTNCSLQEECDGRAKKRPDGGHMTIPDARVLKRRVSRATWESEMLCREPSRTGCVYPGFSPSAHVAAHDATENSLNDAGGVIVAGMDFGVRAPSVIVWGHIAADGLLTIIDEYAETDRTLAHHIAAIKLRPWGPPAWIGIDPAGIARNEQTGVSNYTVMKNMQLQIKARRCGVGEGIESVHARLSPAEGQPTLRISPRCTGLIEALTRYHYPANKLGDQTPEKDGHDHWCDALRYLVVNLEGNGVGVGHL